MQSKIVPHLLLKFHFLLHVSGLKGVEKGPRLEGGAPSPPD
jgi:hypothetical protein